MRAHKSAEEWEATNISRKRTVMLWVLFVHEVLEFSLQVARRLFGWLAILLGELLFNDRVVLDGAALL